MQRPSQGYPSHCTQVNPYASLLKLAADYAQSYLASIHDRHVGVTESARQGMSQLGGEMPADGAAPEAVIRLLHEAGSPATVAVMGGRFFGGVIGGSIPVTVAAHWLADAWDQNACLYEISPVAAYLEEVVLGWLIACLVCQRPRVGHWSPVHKWPMSPRSLPRGMLCCAISVGTWRATACSVRHPSP
jgi:hypothetical protein